jgi:rod shape-determining protein MreD
VAYAIGIPAIALFAILQSAVISQLGLADGQADLVLVAVVAWGLTGRSTEAMVFGLAGGIVLDLLSALPIGTTSLILVLIAYLVLLTEGRLWGAHLLTPLGVVFAASLVFSGCQLLASFLAGAGIDGCIARDPSRSVPQRALGDSGRAACVCASARALPA